MLNDPAKAWKEMLFDKIFDKKVRAEYRSILDEARWKTRNNTVHNGLAPGKEYWKSPSLPDGITDYTSTKALEAYKSDRYSLESLIDQLRQICRFTLLDKILDSGVFPPLKGLEVHSVTVTSTEPATTINLDF